jgi:23S rRNA (guanosine2251-2'-O)-methyltransferase
MKNMIYGIRPIIEAVNSGKEIDKVFVQKGLKGELFRELSAVLSNKNIPIQYVPIEKINKLVPNNHQGVAAFLSEVSYQMLDQLVPMLYDSGKIPLVLILDRITDTRNLGAIARTAECAGVNAIIVPDRGSAQINADAIKTSAGAILSMNICRESNLKTTIHFLKASGFQVVAATEKAANQYTDCDFTVPTAIIMGSEEDGVSKEYLKLCDQLVAIPLLGKIASLNVSVACGVMLYEVVRQRDRKI